MSGSMRTRLVNGDELVVRGEEVLMRCCASVLEFMFNVDVDG